MAKTLKVETGSSHCTTPSECPERAAPLSVKVGCLNINPTTRHGRRMYMLQMLILAFIPHAALIAQNCTIMAQLSSTMDSALYLNTKISKGIILGEAIKNIQAERIVVADSICSMKGTSNGNRSYLSDVFQDTDKVLTFVSESIEDRLILDLYQLRDELSINENFNFTSLIKRLQVYEQINKIILSNMARYVKQTTISFWRLLSSCYDTLSAVENYSFVVTFLKLEFNFGTTLKTEWDLNTLHLKQQTALQYLESAIISLEAEKIDVDRLTQVLKFIKDSELKSNDIRTNGSYLAMAYACLEAQNSFQIELFGLIRKSVDSEVWHAQKTLLISILTVITVLAVSPVLILLTRHTLQTIQGFTESIEYSSQKLMIEKQKSDMLLSRMLPAPVLRRLKAQKTVPAEAFDAVTIFFSDIVGFTHISACSTPMDIINMLNMLYRLFDEKIAGYNVYKVETIGDAYMVVSGLPHRNDNRHASEIANMSLSLMRGLEDARVPHMPEESLKIRAGINTGPCVAGVVGTTMPRYCLFGDAINTASRMESTGEAMKIHISDTTKKALDEIGGYETQSRGKVFVAGKGEMETYWLLSRKGSSVDDIDSPKCLKLHDYDQGLLELIINS